MSKKPQPQGKTKRPSDIYAYCLCFTNVLGVCRILACCKRSLMTTDKSRDAAAFLCARFVTRTDIKHVYLDHVIQWACDVRILIFYTFSKK